MISWRERSAKSSLCALVFTAIGAVGIEPTLSHTPAHRLVTTYLSVLFASSLAISSSSSYGALTASRQLLPAISARRGKLHHRKLKRTSPAHCHPGFASIELLVVVA